MLKVQLTNFICNYNLENFGHEKTLIFSNSLGTNLSMWEDNIDVLSHQFNILRYDKRGHGESTIHQDKVSIAELGNDVIELLNYLKLDKVYFCGLSIGGLIGQWLGINHPSRFEKIVISNTAAKIGNEEGWGARVKQVTENGLGSILIPTAERWFSPDYRAKNPDKVQEILHHFKANSLQGYTACCYAVAAADFREQLYNLDVPLLIIAGIQDEVTTLADGKFIQKHTPIANLVTLDAAHLSNVEHPEEFAKHIIHFTEH
ncbi:3-oxoadipate enol-lactonase [Pedobacter sp. PLR]|uniref:3-oxoadipate enol-lactonase n=1 Tax=Pedobacter sp. PLR TaxID=2994465 RepID=UPI00224594F3|nr:3-oxoadipate enol-lactonase [Pedobacter sp. PLR]MCX2452309.1 3-oxoadipate enol-lactonase [Pedobacter sp. PLR]